MIDCLEMHPQVLKIGKHSRKDAHQIYSTGEKLDLVWSSKVLP